ncbi:hypothetical protein L1887_48634 [Cichorium endivia]|nr:hypothetical protein L1887_48634 [Cichorium endivia]
MSTFYTQTAFRQLRILCRSFVKIKLGLSRDELDSLTAWRRARILCDSFVKFKLGLGRDELDLRFTVLIQSGTRLNCFGLEDRDHHLKFALPPTGGQVDAVTELSATAPGTHWP